MAVALLVLLPVLALWPHTLGGAVFCSEDAVDIFVPFLDFLRASLAQGVLPLWNPHLNSGMTFVGHPNTVMFYPPNYLVAWMAPERYIVWTVAFHAGLGGVGMWWLARRWGFPRWVAFLMGAAYALSTPIFQDAERPDSCQILGWLPWVLVAAAGAMERTRTIVLLGLFLALQLLCAHPQHVQMTVVALGLLWLATWGPQEGYVKSGCRLAAGGLLALGLAGVLLAPLAENVSLGLRTLATPAYFQVYGIGLSDVPGTLFPELFDSRYPTDFSTPFPLVALALLAVVRRPASRRGLLAGGIVLVLAGYLLALANATPLEPVVSTVVPFYASIRYRLRFLTLAVLGFILLAGIGLETLRPARPARFALALGLTLWLVLPVPSFHPPTPVGECHDLPAFALLPDDPEFHRILTQPFLQRKYWNWATVYERSNLGFFGAISYLYYQHLLSYAEFGEPATPSNSMRALDFNMIRTTLDVQAPILRLLGLKYILFSQPPDYRPRVAVREDGVPHGFFCERWIVEPDVGRALARLGAAEFEPTDTAVLDAPVPGLDAGGSAGTGWCRVRLPNNNRLEVEAEWAGTSPGLLVLSEIHDPGWKAELDGQPVPIYRVDLALRGVVVPPGRHRIRMVFQPTSLLVGAAISLLSALLAVAAWFGPTAASRRRP